MQRVRRPFTSLYPLPNIQYRKGALLCFDLLLYSVVNVWRRGVSADLRARPSPLWRAHGHHVGQRRAMLLPDGVKLASHCLGCLCGE